MERVAPSARITTSAEIPIFSAFESVATIDFHELGESFGMCSGAGELDSSSPAAFVFLDFDSGAASVGESCFCSEVGTWSGSGFDADAFLAAVFLAAVFFLAGADLGGSSSDTLGGSM